MVHSSASSLTKLRTLALDAQKASRVTALLTTNQKNAALHAVAEALRVRQDEIIAANEKDLTAGRENNLADSFLDRLLLNEERIDGIASDVENVASLEDYVGQVMESRTQDNGLKIERIRVPLGVVLMIYESRPNVTVDAAVLALKSGNAVILRGGKEAFFSNQILASLIQDALEEAGVPREAVQLVQTTDREAVSELLTMNDLIDIVIPRGGKGLIDLITKTSSIPAIHTGASVVHTYIDEHADLEKATAIAVNAKTRRVSICNTLDVLLVHESVAEDFLRKLDPALRAQSEESSTPLVELVCDKRSMDILQAGANIGASRSRIDAYPRLSKLDPTTHFDTEYLDYTMSIHVVSSLTEAIEHILTHSLKHSEAIVTEDMDAAERFLNEVDAACVYVNASTQFSDGAQFGLGAEIGISTQKLHVRGPFALEGLTTYKWKIYGNGQTRP